MEIKLNHIALLITDLEKARRFYSDILQLREIERPSFYLQGLWYEVGSFQLHLQLYEQAKPPQVHPLNKTVQPHFALSMSNHKMQLILDKLKKAGVQFIGELTRSPAGVLQAFFSDFDGNMIEINNCG